MHAALDAHLRRGAGRPALQPDLRRDRGRSGRHRVHHGRPAVEPGATSTRRRPRPRRPTRTCPATSRPWWPPRRAAPADRDQGHHVPQDPRLGRDQLAAQRARRRCHRCGQRLRGRDDAGRTDVRQQRRRDSTSSQQGGVWFGLGEDDYVKAAVVRVTSTTNKVQLVKEIGAIATPATTYELNSAPFPAGQDVRLVLRVEDTPGDGGTVSVQYAVNGGALTQLTDAANTVSSSALPLPQAFFSGVSLGGGHGVVRRPVHDQAGGGRDRQRRGPVRRLRGPRDRERRRGAREVQLHHDRGHRRPGRLHARTTARPGPTAAASAGSPRRASPAPRTPRST